MIEFAVHFVPLRQGAKRLLEFFRIIGVISVIGIIGELRELRELRELGILAVFRFHLSVFRFPFPLLTVCLDYQFAEEAVGPCEP